MALKLRLAVDEAALCADPGKGLALLDAALAGNWRRQVAENRWSPDRPTLVRLAGIYLRAGIIDEAAELLARGLDIEPVGPADALIVDPEFRVVGGHRHQANLFYLRAAKTAGLSTIVVRPGAKSAIDHDLTGSVGAFAMIRENDLFPLGVGPGELVAMNALFEREFRRSLPARRPRLLIVPTASHAFIEGLAGYVAATQSRGPSSLLLGLMSAYWTPAKTRHRFREPYRRAFEKLAAIDGLRLGVVAETPAIAEGLRTFVDPALEIIVCPYVGGFLDELGTRGPSRGGAITAGFVGQTRRPRGAHLIPEVARRTLAERPRGLAWRVQLDLTKLPDSVPGEAESDVALLAGNGGFELVPPALPTPDYYALLRDIDIMVLPYAKGYLNAPSGIAAECLRIGSVQVVPKGSTMAKAAKDLGAGFVTFRRQTAESVAAAVIEAVDRYPELEERSRAAALKSRADDSHRRIVQFIQAA